MVRFKNTPPECHLLFFECLAKPSKQKTTRDKGCGRKVMVSGPARTFAFPKCCTEAGQRARSAAFIGDTTLRRLGRPGATASRPPCFFACDRTRAFVTLSCVSRDHPFHV